MYNDHVIQSMIILEKLLKENIFTNTDSG